MSEIETLLNDLIRAVEESSRNSSALLDASDARAAVLAYVAKVEKDAHVAAVKECSEIYTAVNEMYYAPKHFDSTGEVFYAIMDMLQARQAKQVAAMSAKDQS